MNWFYVIGAALLIFAFWDNIQPLLSWGLKLAKRGTTSDKPSGPQAFEALETLSMFDRNCADDPAHPLVRAAAQQLTKQMATPPAQ